MKTVKLFAIAATMLAVSCGPSAEEQAKEQARIDSLRNDSIAKVEQALEAQRQDSIAKAEAIKAEELAKAQADSIAKAEAAAAEAAAKKGGKKGKK